MKRQRSDYQREDDENEDEKDEQRRRLNIAADMNRRIKERQEESRAAPTSSSSLYVPTFLRSLAVPTSASTSSSSFETKEDDTAWIEWRQQQAQEEKEEKEEKEAVASAAEKKKLDREAPYMRLFRNPHQRIFDRPERFVMGEKEKKIYQDLSGLEGSSDLSNLIYQYTVPEEIGTPVETCYTLTKNGESKESCTKNIFELANALDNIDREILFEDHKCALYCLFKNLPTTVYLSNSTDQEIILKPFKLKIIIYLDNSDIGMNITIEYDEEMKDHKVWLVVYHRTAGYGDIGYGDISLDDAIDLLFRYGTTSEIKCRFSRALAPDGYDIIKLNYRSPTDNPYWEIVTGNDYDEVFKISSKQERDEGEEDEFEDEADDEDF